MKHLSVKKAVKNGCLTGQLPGFLINLPLGICELLKCWQFKVNQVIVVNLLFQ